MTATIRYGLIQGYRNARPSLPSGDIDAADRQQLLSLFRSPLANPPAPTDVELPPGISVYSRDILATAYARDIVVSVVPELLSANVYVYVPGIIEGITVFNPFDNVIDGTDNVIDGTDNVVNAN